MLQTVQDTRAALRNQINETLSKQCYPSISDIFSRLLNIRNDLDVTRGIIFLALRPKRSWEFDFVAGGRVFGELYQRGVGFYFSVHLFSFFPPFEHKVYLRKTHASNLSSVWTLRNASRVCFYSRVFRPNREKKTTFEQRRFGIFKRMKVCDLTLPSGYIGISSSLYPRVFGRSNSFDLENRSLYFYVAIYRAVASWNFTYRIIRMIFSHNQTTCPQAEETFTRTWIILRRMIQQDTYSPVNVQRIWMADLLRIQGYRDTRDRSSTDTLVGGKVSRSRCICLIVGYGATRRRRKELENVVPRKIVGNILPTFSSASLL